MCTLRKRESVPFPKCLGPAVFQRQGCSYIVATILAYPHIHTEISWDRVPSLNTKFIYVSYILYTCNLKIQSYNIFNNFVHETASQHDHLLLVLSGFGLGMLDPLYKGWDPLPCQGTNFMPRGIVICPVIKKWGLLIDYNCNYYQHEPLHLTTSAPHTCPAPPSAH